ncbi:60S acidic ribosomal protein P2, putative [Entamoeba dispar SAW760]|uniref:60S acidic ribosomal protein P2, putative n=1 Tax=Entamoeba dispar (strain ATCC PRA-260 / SAW760) TaxID=370354 RepID=B0ENU8_ENTDS|nr:60S acidic ribosomal protein P2, putative [Entamoeba dispar SAW760]EDR23787.1 60S acidic ribosomal protein P2, putative [Entamoeba dispar SAW760]|eukprot:EDR23787.1 60S acidic ribosomal protein P2, putative [Entamoeba dispar SAW760]
MQYIAAYILCTIGHEHAEEAKVKEILTAAGAEIDEAKIKQVFDAMNGKNVWEVIEAGKKQMGSMAVAAAAPAAGAAAQTETKAEEKKEEKKEEEEEEDFGGFGDLF